MDVDILNPLIIKAILLDYGKKLLTRFLLKKTEDNIMKDYLKGKKTYIVAIGLVFTAIGSFINGDLTLVEAIVVIMNGLGFGALRAGVAK